MHFAHARKQLVNGASSQLATEDHCFLLRSATETTIAVATKTIYSSLIPSRVKPNFENFEIGIHNFTA